MDRKLGSILFCMLVLLGLLVNGHVSRPMASASRIDLDDSVSPVIVDFYVNNTWAGQPSQFNFNVSDSVGLDHSVFGCNVTQSFVNDSAVSLSRTQAWANCTHILPSFDCTISFQFWVWNSYLAVNATGLRYVRVYTYNSTAGAWNTPFNSLSDTINAVEQATHWDKVNPYIGLVLGQDTTLDLTNKIDSYANSADWVDVLKWCAITNKLNITWTNKTNDISYALGNYTMVGYLPATQYGAFYTQDKWGLYGFWFNNQSWIGSYENNTKWDIMQAYSQFNSSCYTLGVPPAYVSWVDGHGEATAASNRYYDEAAETIQCYILFSVLLNVSNALNDASYWWNWINSNLWSDNYGGYYRYNTYQSEPAFETEAGFFLKIISQLKYYVPNLTNWQRVLTDIGNRFLSNEWNSKQWLAGMANTTTYVVIHDWTSNNQTRLSNTLGAWQALLGVYLQFNNTYQTNLKDMLYGNLNTQPAWSLLLTPTANLFDNMSNQFKGWSDSGATDYQSSAYGELLLFMMGIVPGTSTIAFPLEELGYEYLYDINPLFLQFNLNQTTRAVKIPVVQAGTITFQYGCSPVSCNFSQAGIWQISFTNSWNNAASVQRLGNLPSNMIYFQNIVSTPTHDVAVVDVTSSKTVIGLGYSSEIEATIANLGTFSETFNVTACTNTTTVATRQISNLNAMDEAMVMFTWNTSGLAYGNYTLNAYAWPVLNETDTVNNNFTGGVVILTIPGDINGDFNVSFSDLAILANAYGCTPQMPLKWNPNADINGNNVVDLTDLVILALHYRQQYP